MPLKPAYKWPRVFGFEIYGRGPCYVIYVEKGSVAHRSGLMPGDQVLELEGRDVTTLSAESLRILARQARTQPPAVEVVSCLRQVDIPARSATGYGFTLVEGRPLVVGAVDFGSPAYRAGLRTGDVILEVNSQPALSLDDVGRLSKAGRMSLLTIPVGRTGNMVSIERELHKATPARHRVQRARDLHDKMNLILGDDYEKKMAVVGVLKQYAEDRDVDVFCEALGVILKTPHQRRILRQIRPFVPPSHRARFEELMKMKNPAAGNNHVNHSSEPSSSPSPGGLAHKVGYRRVIQVIRDDGSFGFVIKGSNPAYIETVDGGGPAEKAGLQPRDFIMRLNGIDVRRADHNHLVQLLQDSGTAPTLEILRCVGGIQSPTVSLSSMSSNSSGSSHASTDWLTSNTMVDKEGRTFKQRVDFLLTTKEKNHLKRSLQAYEVTRDVVQLESGLSQILDTPSKRTLWMFIIARLPPQHQEFCVHRVSLPQHILLEVLKTQQKINGHGQLTENGLHSDWETHIGTSARLPASFQQQIEFLLTSQERIQIRRSLHMYDEDRDIKKLCNDLEGILDTPSKKTLWKFILPLLTSSHQEVVARRLQVQQHYSETLLAGSAMDSYIGPDDEDEDEDDGHEDLPEMEEIVIGGESRQKPDIDDLGSLTSEEEEDSSAESEESLELETRSRGHKEKSEQALLRELEETRKAVQEIKDALMNKTVIFGDSKGGLQNGEALDSRRFVTVIPVAYQGQSDHSNTNTFRSNGSFMRGGNFHLNSTVYNDSQPRSPRPNMMEEVDETDFEDKGGDLSSFSGDTFNQKAMFALKELDAVMAAEAADLDNPTSPISSFDHGGNTSDGPVFPRSSLLTRKDSINAANTDGPMFTRSSLLTRKDSNAANTNGVLSRSASNATSQSSNVSRGNVAANWNSKVAVPPPPPPPPPPPGVPGMSKPDAGGMNVKRINWEKLDNNIVENTIWRNVSKDNTALEKMVKNLSLENQFSTKMQKTNFLDKRQEVCILNPKKAYNVSILLGHLKMTGSQVKQALYLMDEHTLTPELLKQLLAYAPNANEMDSYDAYTGDTEDLSKPDQFSYEMSRMPGYEQRLKAMLFKTSFEEKITEMKENLRCIKTASHELRHSQKLAKVLELILAMGNYMNQGNQRVGGASGFRITFLTQLDVTKTSDNKSTFLHVLVDTIRTKFPELVQLGDELNTIPMAAKVSNILLHQELADLRKALQDMSGTLEKVGSHTASVGTTDRFQDVIGHFIGKATDEVQSLCRLQAAAMEEFHEMGQYFGEDPKKMDTSDIFGIFSQFIQKFEKAHREKLINLRH